MEFILSLVIKSMGQVWLAWLHNWPYLAVSVVIATLLKLYVNGEKVSAFLNRYRRAGVVAAMAAAVTTPLCSCGTTAVVLGLMASRMPWAPIVAFMVASPLTSPEGLIYSAGLFGWPFAWAFYLASIGLGLVGGWIAAVFESRGWLANQARFAEAKSAPRTRPANNQVSLTPRRLFTMEVSAMALSPVGATCGCAGTISPEPVASCGCDQDQITPKREGSRSSQADDSADPAQSNRPVPLQKPPVTLTTFWQELYHSGKYLVVMFTGFAFVGYFLNGLIPASWVATLFGSGNIYNVPLAATLGLPLYINSEASLPLIRALLDNGMSQGAALAFLISGSGTSIGAITGALTIARWRIVGIVVATLWIGAILAGILFNLFVK